MMHRMIDDRVKDIAREIAMAGGRALAVGGYVRDHLRGQPSKDLDIEVYGIDLDALRKVLESHGNVISVGRAFGVLRLKDLNADFSLPRRDNKVAPGHRGFDVECDPNLDFRTAARRRDLTVNSMGLDILSGEISDPYGGQRDLEHGVLRAVDPDTFAEDPLRGLRVAQFSARFDMRADGPLVELCGQLDLHEVSPERVFEEFRKLLLKGVRPSLGLTFLRDSTLLRFFPELDDLTHRSAWSRTLVAVDRGAKMRRDGDGLVLMFGALCHALRGPDDIGSLLDRMRAPGEVVARVAALVEDLAKPALFVDGSAAPGEYRRLARTLGAVGVTLELLARAAQIASSDAPVQEFLAQARELGVDNHAPVDVVRGRHLISRGFAPGPRLGAMLELCREVQDETGWRDAERILDEALNRVPSR